MSAAAPLVVVAGVTATGKSTVGRALARRLGVAYGDADDFHPPGNIAKMRAGEPLTDSDRQPWLAAIAEWLGARADVGAVASCSALSRAHREQVLSRAPAAVFLQLSADEAVLRSRLRQRDDHFMPESLVQSQLDAFEPLEPDEPGLEVDAEQPVKAIVTELVRWLSARDDRSDGPRA